MVIGNQVQEAFVQGFQAQPSTPNPYLYSSACWVAFQAGRLYYNRGGHAGRLTTCKSTRGHAVKLGTGEVYRLVNGAVIQTRV
jgi:hypothetical protein